MIDRNFQVHESSFDGSFERRLNFFQNEVISKVSVYEICLNYVRKSITVIREVGPITTGKRDFPTVKRTRFMFEIKCLLLDGFEISNVHSGVN